MKLNVTTIILLAVVGLVAWKLLGEKSPALMGGTPTGAPAGGTQQTQQPDMFTSILNSATSIFNSVATIAQTTQKTA